MIQYIFGAGVAVGGLLGFRAGKAVGGFGAKRKLKKIRKVLGDTAVVAKEKAGRVAAQAKGAAVEAGQKINEMMEE